MLLNDALRHANSGPMPVRNSRNKPMEGDAIKERCADGDFISLHILRDDGEQSAPQDREAGGEQHQVIEEEARLAGNQRLQFVFDLRWSRCLKKGE